MTERWITDTTPNERWPVYTRANAAEVMGDPVSPLGWTYVWERACLPAWRDAYVAAGTMSAAEFGENSAVAGCFGGYFYVNLSNIRTYGARLGSWEAADRGLVGDHPDKPPYAPHPDDADPEAMARAGAGMAEALGWSKVPYVDGERDRAVEARRSRPDLAALTPAELVARADAMLRLVERPFFSNAVAGSMAAIPPAMLAGVYAALGQPDRSIELLAGLGDIDSTGPAVAAWELSRRVRTSAALTAAFDAGTEGLPGRLAALDDPDAAAFGAGFDSFLVEYGSRGPAEWDIVSPVWETDPEQALRHIDRLRRAPDGLDVLDSAPEARNTELRAARAVLADELAAATAHDPALSGTVATALRASKAFIVARERAKTAAIRAVHEIRMALLELGRRAAAAGTVERPEHVMMLLAPELADFAGSPDGWGPTLAGRAGEFAGLAARTPPFFVDTSPGAAAPSSGTDADRIVEGALPGEQLQGIGGSAGIARGRARVVRDPYADSGLEPGDILVAPSTDPSWTPLFLAAGAVVVNIGGVNSHAVIVSRELGVPCVVSVAGATERIKDGAELTVDGSAGTILIH
jgi:pyruvate,water dikinase